MVASWSALTPPVRTRASYFFLAGAFFPAGFASALAGFASAFLAAGFIWLAENVGTFTHTWAYPGRHDHWSPVGLAKLGSWFLLQIVSYALVLLVRRPEPPDEAPIAESRERHEARLAFRSART